LINNNSNISFGSSVRVANLSARAALSRYDIKVVKSLINASEKLSGNGVKDLLVFNFHDGKGFDKAKKNDTLHMSFWPTEKNCQSSIQKKLSVLEKMTPEKITKFILDTYEKLKISRKKSAVGSYPKKPTEKISRQKSEKINELVDAYGYDDWTCA